MSAKRRRTADLIMLTDGWWISGPSLSGGEEEED